MAENQTILTRSSMAARVADVGICAQLLKKSAFTKPLRSFTFSNCTKTIPSCSYSLSNLNLHSNRSQFFDQSWKISTSVNCRGTGDVKVRNSGSKEKVSSDFGSKEVSSNGGEGFSLGLEEEEGHEICLGCGIFMQNKYPEAPGFFIRLAKKVAFRDLEEQKGEQILDILEEEEADTEDEVEITETVDKDEVLEGDMRKEEDLDLDLVEEKLRKKLHGFVRVRVDYGKISAETVELRKKGRTLTEEEEKKAEDRESLMEDMVVCERCYALRHYGDVKVSQADDLLPDFDFETAVVSRITKSSIVEGSGQTVVVMVVDAVDFDGSFPRQAATMINNALNQGNPNAISVVLAVTKCDLLPSQFSPVRMDEWVCSRASVLGAPQLNKVFLLSARKDWGINNFTEKIRDLAGPRGNVWFIGARNVGKSALVNAVMKEGGKVAHLTESVVPGTTLGILRIGGILPDDAKLYDTPGLLHPYQITMRLNSEEQKMIEISEELKPKTYRVKVTQPWVKVLRLVDSDLLPMGYLYEAMDRANGAVQRMYARNRNKLDPLESIINRRWTHQLHRPLHAAGYYFNPKFFYDDNFEADDEVMDGLYTCMDRMIPDDNLKALCPDEIQAYKKADGRVLSSVICKMSRKTLRPDLWWEDNGARCPNLQRMAMRILSQPCSASGCERNWSMFESIHTKRRNRLSQQRLNDLVFVQYNLRLHVRQVEGTDCYDAIDLDSMDPLVEWVAEDEEPIFTDEDIERLEREAAGEAEGTSRAHGEGTSSAAAAAFYMEDEDEDEDEDEYIPEPEYPIRDEDVPVPLPSPPHVVRSEPMTYKRARGKRPLH